MKEIEKLASARRFIRDQKEQFRALQKSDCIALNDTAIYLWDILDSLISKIESACNEGHQAPLLAMMLSSLEGLSTLFQESYNQDSESAITSLSEYTTELYHVYRSSMYGIVEPQLLDGVSLFRDIPEGLVEKYYSFIDAVSYTIRNESKSECESKFFYLLVPGTIPSVKINKLFCSDDLERRLLIIYFPRILLFQPKVLIPSLIHETAHYSGGDNERRREERLYKMLDVISYFIIFQTGKPITNAAYMYMRQLLGIEFNKIVKEYEKTYALKMLDFLGPLLRIITYRLSDPEIIQNWATDVAHASSEQPEEYVRAYNKCLTDGLCGRVMMFTNCLVDIFSEVYADLVAIVVLDLTLEEYLFMLSKNGSEFKLETSFQERLQIVINTCWPDSLGSKVFEKPSWLNSIYYKNIIEWNNESNDFAFPLPIRERIVDHFSKIYENSFPALKGECSNSLLELRKLYHSL